MSPDCHKAVKPTELVVTAFTWILFSSGITVYGGPSSEWGAGKHVWELHRPERLVVARVTR